MSITCNNNSFYALTTTPPQRNHFTKIEKHDTIFEKKTKEYLSEKK